MRQVRGAGRTGRDDSRVRKIVQRPAAQTRLAQDSPSLLHRRTEHAAHPRVGEHQAAAGALHHTGRAPQVLLHTAEAGRRIEGSRHGAGELDAEEGGEEFNPGGEDESHAVAAPDPQGLETGADGQGTVADLGPAEPGGPLGPVHEAQPSLRSASGPLQPVEKTFSH